MKAIIKEFIEGDSIKKLAIISNISTILGVSIATFVAGPFLSKFSGINFVLADFIISILFYFMFVWVTLWVIYDLVRRLIDAYSSKNYPKTVNLLIVGLLVLWGGIVFFPYAKSFVGNAFNSSYMLAPTGQEAIVDSHIQNVQRERNYVTSKGKVSFKKNVDSSNYMAAIYLLLSNGRYERLRGLSEFNLAGEYLISETYYSEENKGQDAYLVVYRKTDWSLFHFNDSGYPEILNMVPNPDLDQTQAWYKKLDVDTISQ